MWEEPGLLTIGASSKEDLLRHGAHHEETARLQHLEAMRLFGLAAEQSSRPAHIRAALMQHTPSMSSSEVDGILQATVVERSVPLAVRAAFTMKCWALTCLVSLPRAVPSTLVLILYTNTGRK